MSTPKDMPDAYERVIYRASVIPDTLPERLGGLARLFGFPAADPRTARVLELGCGTGINLLSMATIRPEGRYLGIDASRTQIELGRGWARSAGLHQVELRSQRIEDLRDEQGFDYIVCHGVYSWVPPQVQREVLRVIRALLTPQGVAHLSFNSLPGWHLRAAVRAAMLWEALGTTDFQERVAAGRRGLDLLTETAPPGPWGQLLQEAVAEIKRQPDWYIFHDLLAEHNEALYLHQLLDRLRPHGLGALATIPPAQMTVDLVPEPVRRSVVEHSRGDRLRSEQILDLYHRRSFRQVLLCGAEHAEAEPLLAEHLASVCYEPRLVLDEAGYTSHLGTRLDTGNPVVHATVRQLHGLRPQVQAFSSLLDTLRAELGADAGVDAAALQEILRQLVLLDAVRPSLVPWEGPRRSRRPRLPALARVLAEEGADTVPNLRHFPVKTTFVQRQLLRLCDGAHSPADMVNQLVRWAMSGELDILDSRDQRVEDPLRLATLCSELVAEELERLPLLALMEA